MNKLILLGRLTRDPVVSCVQGGNGTVTIAKYDLAVQRKFKKQGETDVDFFNCVSFGKQAEIVERYLKQGSKVLITGRVQNNNYTNKDGQKVYNVQVMVEELEFAESKANQNTQENTPVQNNVNNGFMNIPDGFQEELPFN